MQPLISVIVPVYNAQDVLQETMGNLIYQTAFERYGEGSVEILLIDDCSTDQTPLILDDLAGQFPDRLFVLHLPENLGPGGARNAGMDAARGHYLGFVDADDMVDVSYFEIMYETATGGGLAFDYVDAPVYYEDTGEALLMTPPELAGELDAAAKSNLLTNVGFLFTKLIRREFLEAYHLRTREHITSEDEDFLAEIICRAASCGVCDQPLYVRRNRPRSAQDDNMMKPFSTLVSCALSAYGRLTSIEDYESFRYGAEAFYLIRLAQALKLYEAYHVQELMSPDFDAQILSTVRRACETVVHGGVEENPYAMAILSDKDMRRLQKYLGL
ncbi:MAG: glycosyltransferase family 2 protein [Lachnospiraceae bacterium]|nr:glycosyltransferase family 2 protein [Lachnospiraceae bacterium]